MLFLINDVVFDFDQRALMPPMEVTRFDAVSMNYVVGLGRELYSEEPLLHRVAPERARRLAALLSFKQPGINAALFVSPARHCAPKLVAARFCNLSIEVMAQLRHANENGSLDALTADREVWRRLAA